MAKKKNGLTRYTTYTWGAQDHDPVLDLVDTAMETADLSVTKASAKTRVATSTIHNWKLRKTKRPQLATVAAVLVAAGVDNIPITAEARRKFRESLK
jgi:hypothetical protein